MDIVHVSTLLGVEMSTNMSFRELAQSMIEIYESILDQNLLTDNKKDSSIISSINFLRNITNIDRFEAGNVEYSDIYHFFNLIVDIVGLVSASEGSFEPLLKLGDTKLIGRRKEIKGIYKGDDDTIAQNMCALLFQGWIKNQDFFEISKDLKNIVTKGKSACDFLLESKGQKKILVECKRIHSTKKFRSYDELIEIISKKTVGWVEKSLDQIESTEDFFNEGRTERHVLVDVSSFGKNCHRDFGDCTIIGLLSQQEIKDVAENVKKYCAADVDCITLCWSEVYIFENKPRAIAYRSETFSINNSKVVFVNYGGWTVEFYPSGKQTSEFKELRISKVARSKDWIKASWLSCTDNLFTVSAPN